MFWWQSAANFAKRFGSVDKWAEEFIASAKVAAGWAMLVMHPVNGRLYNVVSDEHAQGPRWLALAFRLTDPYNGMHENGSRSFAVSKHGKSSSLAGASAIREPYGDQGWKSN